MPVKNGRLVCCTCGADLGDAEDPYRDPDCAECEKRELEGELAEHRRDQLLFDLFVTAMEGGIGYWSAAQSYRWSTGDGTTEDVRGFHAVIMVPSEDQTQKPVKYTIDRAVIEKGLTLLAEGKCTFAGQPWTERQAEYAGLNTGASDDCDAENADQIMQAGLFGDVMYG